MKFEFFKDSQNLTKRDQFKKTKNLFFLSRKWVFYQLGSKNGFFCFGSYYTLFSLFHIIFDHFRILPKLRIVRGSSLTGFDCLFDDLHWSNSDIVHRCSFSLVMLIDDLRFSSLCMPLSSLQFSFSFPHSILVFNLTVLCVSNFPTVIYRIIPPYFSTLLSPYAISYFSPFLCFSGLVGFNCLFPFFAGVSSSVCSVCGPLCPDGGDRG